MWRFSALSWLSSLPSAFALLFDKEVPGEFWQAASFDPGSQMPAAAVVSCPCGEEPEVEQNGIAICAGENCGRFFVLLGDRIRSGRFEEQDQP